MKHAAMGLAMAGAAAMALGCASGTPAEQGAAKAADGAADVQAVLQRSFHAQGIATMDRLRQDEANAACSQAQGRPLDEKTAAAIEQAGMKSIVFPADRRFLGDWREGEKLAQNGRGMTWTDPSAAPSANGGNCYNCHQLSKSEISFGTIGPSLYQYGKLRGITDPAAASAQPILEYTWGKLYNARAYNACSDMPRFGHSGLLDEAQLKHLMALLIDPASPVNQ